MEYELARKTVVLRGEVMYAKVLGAPALSPNFPKDGRSWSVDLILTPETEREAKALGLAEKFSTNRKNPKTFDGRPFLSFKQREFRRSGEENDPVTVKDAAGHGWDEKKLIGNGSVCDIRFDVTDEGGMYIKSMRVLQHIPYEPGVEDFQPLTKDDPYYSAVSAAPDFEKDFGLPSDVERELDDSDIIV